MLLLVGHAVTTAVVVLIILVCHSWGAKVLLQDRRRYLCSIRRIPVLIGRAIAIERTVSGRTVAVHSTRFLDLRAGVGLVAANSLATITVRVDAGINLVHGVALVGASGVGGRAGVAAEAGSTVGAGVGTSAAGEAR